MTPSKDILLIAGAGTGKTYRLVEEFAAAITSADLERDEFVLVTFTEKAAQELQDRLLQKFSGRPEIISWLEEHPATTLHSFARKLLSRFPTHAGINPGFQILQGAAEKNLRDRVFEAFLARLASDPPDSLKALLDAGMEPRTLKRALFALLPRAELLGAIPEIPAEEMERRLSGAVTALLSWSGSASAPPPLPPSRAKSPTAKAYLAALPALASLAEEAASLLTQTPVEALAAVFRMRGLTPSHVMRLGRPLKDLAKEQRAAEALAVEAVQAALSRPFLELFTGFFAEYEAQKAHRALLSFNDLARLARRMLLDNPSLRLELRNRIKRIFVDEFQDTDPVFMELVMLLGYDKPETPEAEGRLFLVGDPRQSIYHFRDADLRVFLDIKRKFEHAGGETRLLRTSRRSAPPVIRFVNTLFSSILQDPPEEVSGDPTFEMTGIEYDLAPLREDYPGGEVWLLSPDPPDIPPAAAAARRLEALLAVSAAKAIAGKAQVGYRDEHVRTAGYSDIAVLVPTNEDVSIVEEAFAAAGVPCASEGSRIFVHRMEVKTLVSLLSALFFPEDPAAVFSALKSPALSVPDGEILNAKQAGWPLTLTADPPEGAGENLTQAVRFLRGFLPPAGFQLPSVLGETLVEKGGLRELFSLLDPTGSRLWGLRTALDLMAEEENAGTDVPTILERLASPDVSPAAPGSIPEHIPAVRIMTVHAAKGLQWPCVIAFDLGRGPGGGTSKDVSVIPRGNGAEFRLPTSLETPGGRLRIQSPGFEQAREQERSYLAAEWLRTLYVAFTRAEDILVIPSVSMARHTVEGASRTSKAVKHLFTKINETSSLEGVRTVSLPPCGEDAGTLRKILAGLRSAPSTAAAEAPTPQEPPAQTGTAPSDHGAAYKGTLFHHLMELYISSGGREETARNFLSELPEAQRRDLERLFRNTLATGIPSQALAHSPPLVEFPVWTGKGLARVDLAFHSPEGWIIVDYKTDPASNREQELVEEYRDQLTAYAAALRNQGLQVAKAVLLLADSGRTHDYLAEPSSGAGSV